MRNALIKSAVAGVLLLGPLSSGAEDAAKPEFGEVLFENDRVRVIEVTIPPGATHDMHSHPDHVVYALGDSKVRFTGEDGKTAEAEIKTGGVRWQDATSHKTENVGTTPVRAVLVELKEGAK